MQCPICNSSLGIEIDIHADGYADNLLECSSCGALWINEHGEQVLIKKVA